MKRKPTGFVAVCQCGITIGALDITRIGRKEPGAIIGKWLHDGCTVIPKFEGSWGELIRPCQCKKGGKA